MYALRLGASRIPAINEAGRTDGIWSRASFE